MEFESLPTPRFGRVTNSQRHAFDPLLRISRSSKPETRATPKNGLVTIVQAASQKNTTQEREISEWKFLFLLLRELVVHWKYV